MVIKNKNDSTNTSINDNRKYCNMSAMNEISKEKEGKSISIGSKLRNEQTVKKEVSPKTMRKDLHKEVLRRSHSNSITMKEQNFLSNVLNEGSDHDVNKLKHKLFDDELFFNIVEKSSNNEEKMVLKPLPPLLTIELPRLSIPCKLKLQERAISSSSIKSKNSTLLNDKIWRAHEEGICLNKSTKNKVSTASIAANLRKKKILHRSISLGSTNELKNKISSSQALNKTVLLPLPSLAGVSRAQMERSKSVSFCPKTTTASDSNAATTTKNINIDTMISTDHTQISFRDSITTKSDEKKGDEKQRSKDEGQEKQQERPFITKATPLRRESSVFGSDSLADELNLNCSNNSSTYYDESRCDDNDNQQQNNQKYPWSSSTIGNHPILMRESSKGNGVEVSVGTPFFNIYNNDQMRQYDSLFASLASSHDNSSLRSSNNNSHSHLRRRSLSLDELTTTTNTSISNLLDNNNEEAECYEDINCSERSLLGNMSCVSWDEIELNTNNSNNKYFDAWAILDDEYAISNIGYNDATLPFKILGTNSTDTTTKPKVLSPPLMDSLINFLPDSLDTSTNFWLKYSLVRDGANLYTMLQHIRGTYNTIIAIESMDGDVFGCYVHAPWKLSNSTSNHFYGDGQAFLWKMRRNRYSNTTNATAGTSILDQAILESELDVYPWTGKNYMIQICSRNRIGLGGGATTTATNNNKKSSLLDESGLFGLALEDDLLSGTTGPCATFNNSCLAPNAPDGVFEVANLEVWTLTPCNAEDEAEKLDFHKLFFSDNVVTTTTT